MDAAGDTASGGEMLTANLHLLRNGMQEARVTNYYAENNEELIIPLNPALSPQANAQRYFKKYRKLRDGKKYLLQRLKTTQSELTYLDTLLVAAQTADLSALFEIEEEMAKAGLIRSKTRQKRSAAPPSQPLHFLSPDGIDVFIGKNNRQNDFLTLRFAAPTDFCCMLKMCRAHM